MNIDEIRAARFRAEEHIAGILIALQHDTGMNVDSLNVDLYGVEIIGDVRRSIIGRVEIKLVMP